MTSFEQPVPMLLIPAPRVRILAEAGSQATAQVVMVSPWVGLPVPLSSGDGNVVHEWRCCGTGQPGIIETVTLHLPYQSSDPAFTISINCMDATQIQHLLDEHGFFAG